MNDFFAALYFNLCTSRMLHPGNPFRALLAAQPGAETQDQVIGSGIELLPGIVLTAHHVVEKFLMSYEGMEYRDGQRRLRNNAANRKFQEGTYTTQAGLTAVGFDVHTGDFSVNPESMSIDGTEIRDFSQKVKNIQLFDSTELAFLQAEPAIYRDQKVRPESPAVGIDLRPPPVGLKIQACGFPGRPKEQGTPYALSLPSPGTVDSKGRSYISCPAMTGGQVEGVEMDFGGTNCFDFARVQTDMETRNGMSGAGAFRGDNGALMGVVSWGGAGYTFVAMLWPVVASPLFGAHSLQDLARDGKLKAEDIHRVSLKDGIPIYERH